MGNLGGNLGSLPTWQMKLGEGIRAAREARGYTQERLATELGLRSRESIRLYESGESPPKTDVLRRIVTLLNADFAFDGCRISAQTLPPAELRESTEQMTFDFHHEYVYRRATVRVTASPRELMITATVPA